MRYILSVLIVFCLICPDTLGQRKKVGVVLSGGGAKGVAHIGVLKVLEEAGDSDRLYFRDEYGGYCRRVVCRRI